MFTVFRKFTGAPSAPLQTRHMFWHFAALGWLGRGEWNFTLPREILWLVSFTVLQRDTYLLIRRAIRRLAWFSTSVSYADPVNTGTSSHCTSLTLFFIKQLLSVLTANSYLFIYSKPKKSYSGTSRGSYSGTSRGSYSGTSRFQIVIFLVGSGRATLLARQIVERY